MCVEIASDLYILLQPRRAQAREPRLRRSLCHCRVSAGASAETARPTLHRARSLKPIFSHTRGSIRDQFLLACTVRRREHRAM